MKESVITLTFLATSTVIKRANFLQIDRNSTERRAVIILSLKNGYIKSNLFKNTYTIPYHFLFHLVFRAIYYYICRA